MPIWEADPNEPRHLPQLTVVVRVLRNWREQMDTFRANLAGRLNAHEARTAALEEWRAATETRLASLDAAAHTHPEA